MKRLPSFELEQGPSFVLDSLTTIQLSVSLYQMGDILFIFDSNTTSIVTLSSSLRIRVHIKFILSCFFGLQL